MGRIDLLRHHIAYKTKAILDIATRLPAGSKVLMFGDNAEYDSFIYTGARLFMERRISVAGLRDWLRGARVEDAVISQVVSADLTMPDQLSVAGIYIRSIPGYTVDVNSRFEGTWYQFDHWAQVAWSLLRNGFISPASWPRLLREFHNLHGVPLAHLRWCIYRAMAEQDLPSELRTVCDGILHDIGSIGASGPSRRMMSWDFDLKLSKPIDSVGGFDARLPGWIENDGVVVNVVVDSRRDSISSLSHEGASMADYSRNLTAPEQQYLPA
jgi:hypothetical protein